MLIHAPLALIADLRLALRSLLRTPGFTLIAVLTLALGIGANTAAFSILNEVFLRPMAYPETESLERIYRVTPQTSRSGVSPADYADLRAVAAGYGEIAAYGFTEVNLSSPGEPAQTASALRVTANLFPVHRIEPQLGRSFRPEEEVRGNHRVVVISHRLWQTRFGGDPTIVGRTVRMDGEPHEIVGVLPAAMYDWRHIGIYDVFRPLGLTDEEARDRRASWVRLVGRRSDRLTRAQGDAFIASFGKRLAAEHPAALVGTTWRTLPLMVATAPDYGYVIFGMLIALSGCVMLIACSNLANLLLARTMARAREFAVRAAVGASRAALLRPLFAEALILALLGGLGAVQVASWTNAWMRGYGDQFQFGIDWRVLGWTLGACLFTVVAFGVAPALFALRLDLNRTLKSGGRGSTSGRGHQRFRHALIVGQFALAMILIAGATLFVRAVDDMNGRNLGWDSSAMAGGSMMLPAVRYDGPAALTRFHREALERLEALPGVASASVSYGMPFFGLADPRKIVVDGRAAPAPGREPVAAINGVSPHYFETVGTRVIDGRTFDDRDSADAPKVFVINEAMAQGLFPGESPLGRRIAWSGETAPAWGEIVGIVGNVKSVYPDRVGPAYQVYVPLFQEPRAAVQLAVRTSGAAPAALVDRVRATIASLDPDLAVNGLQAADLTVARAKREWSIIGEMLAFLAVLGLILASVGMYGVVARTMAQRTSEFGIRLAMGAVAPDIIRLVLAAGAKLALIGSVIGLVGAFAFGRLIRFAFPLLDTTSPVVLAGVTLFLTAIALFACYMPARYASKISPTEALRTE